MVKHVILWKLKESLSDEERELRAKGVKEGLEGLVGVVPGLIELHIRTDHLPSSTADLLLTSTFESAEALKGYSVHPAHVAVANEKVRPFAEIRLCLDFEED